MSDSLQLRAVPNPPASLELMIVSYQKAANRFLGGGDRPRLLIPRQKAHLRDPERHPDPGLDRIHYADLYGAMADALRCARAVDQRITKLGSNRQWWLDHEDGEVVPGLRYLRNAVDHDFADALAYDGPEPRQANRRIIYRLVWASVEGKRNSGKWAYKKHLVGQPVLTSFTCLVPMFWEASNALEVRGIAVG